jgi:hypothetical protein
MKVIKNPKSDPLWDEVGRVDHDFTTHWGGLYIHYYTAIDPKDSEKSTIELVEKCCKEIAIYIQDNKVFFSKEDRFQIVIGWPTSIRTSCRQIVKTGGTWEDIDKLVTAKLPIKFYPGWSNNLFIK